MHILVVFANATEGNDVALNDWYTNRHLGDLLKIRGVRAAQRFELASTEPPQQARHRYLAIYEVEDGMLETVRAALKQLGLERAEAIVAGREPALPVSDALDVDHIAWWFNSISARRVAPQADTTIPS